MYTKSLFIIFLLVHSTYATDSTIDTQEIVSIDFNTIKVDNNCSREINTTIILKEKMEKSFQSKQPILKSKNFNMTKGNSQEGEKIFNKNLKKNCQITSYKFVTHYSQDKWEEIAESGRFRESVFKLCPTIKLFYQDSWSPDLYQFAYEHANDN